MLVKQVKQLLMIVYEAQKQRNGLVNCDYAKNRSVGTMLSRGQSRESRRKRAYVSKPVIINYNFFQFVKAIGTFFFSHKKIIMIKNNTQLKPL